MSSLLIYRNLRGSDRIVFGVTTAYAISAYHHWCSEFEYDKREEYNVMRSSLSVTCDMSVISSGFLHQYNWPSRYSWSTVKSAVNHHQTNNRQYVSKRKSWYLINRQNYQTGKVIYTLGGGGTAQADPDQNSTHARFRSRWCNIAIMNSGRPQKSHNLTLSLSV